MKFSAYNFNLETGKSSQLKALAFSMMALFLVMLLSSKTLAAPNEVVITEGSRQALPIAIAPFEIKAPELRDIATKVRSIVEADLRRTGLFRLIRKKAFIEQNLSLNTPPRFKDWRLIKADNVVVTRISLSNFGELQVEYRLWDSVLSKQLTGQRFTARLKSWRRAGHLIANSIYQRLIGAPGYFNTKIVYIDETGPRDLRVKRLAIMDQDGFNVRLLTNGRAQIRSPRFSPVRPEIIYIANEEGEQRIYLLNVNDGRRKLVGGFTNLLGAPRFSPDGDKLVLSLVSNGSVNLHVLNIHSGQMRQITDSKSRDTSPAFARDGQQVIFISDKGEGSQIYKTDLRSNQPKRLSKGAGKYRSPIWSPGGDLIAFVKEVEDRDVIGIMDADGGRERILAQAKRIRQPAWSPNGRTLLYHRDSLGPNSGPRLYSIDVLGVNNQNVPTPSFGSEPTWGPAQ